MRSSASTFPEITKWLKDLFIALEELGENETLQKSDYLVEHNSEKKELSYA